MTTLTLQPDETASKDTFLRNDAGQAINYGSNQYLYVGGREPDYYRQNSLIRFDMSSIPAGAIINSAVFSLYLVAEGSDNAKTLSVYRLLRDWNELQATWLLASTGVSWGTSGARSTSTDIYATPLGSRSFTTTEALGFKDFTLTAAEIKKMIDGTYSNYGFNVISSSESNSNMEWGFASATYATASYRPKFVIDYTPPAGGSQAIWWFKKWWKEKQELISKPKILLPEGVVI